MSLFQIGAKGIRIKHTADCRMTETRKNHAIARRGYASVAFSFQNHTIQARGISKVSVSSHSRASSSAQEQSPEQPGATQKDILTSCELDDGEKYSKLTEGSNVNRFEDETAQGNLRRVCVSTSNHRLGSLQVEGERKNFIVQRKLPLLVEPPAPGPRVGLGSW